MKPHWHIAIQHQLTDRLRQGRVGGNELVTMGFSSADPDGGIRGAIMLPTEPHLYVRWRTQLNQHLQQCKLRGDLAMVLGVFLEAEESQPSNLPVASKASGATTIDQWQRLVTAGAAIASHRSGLPVLDLMIIHENSTISSRCQRITCVCLSTQVREVPTQR